LKCDDCGDVLDRRPKDDFGGYKHDGTFATGEETALLHYAESLGWTTFGKQHLCPKHPQYAQGSFK
jgi:hypothetical protein